MQTWMPVLLAGGLGPGNNYVNWSQIKWMATATIEAYTNEMGRNTTPLELSTMETCSYMACCHGNTQNKVYISFFTAYRHAVLRFRSRCCTMNVIGSIQCCTATYLCHTTLTKKTQGIYYASGHLDKRSLIQAGDCRVYAMVTPRMGFIYNGCLHQTLGWFSNLVQWLYL